MTSTEESTDPPRTGHESKTRAEHLAWCKGRALAELDADPHGAGPGNALASMTSDTGKHPETTGHPGNELGTTLLVTGHLSRPDQVRKHIEDYQ